jgi:plastocyanin
MANNVKILITEQNGVTVYTPNPANANKGDQVFWTNDTPQAHWPMPKGGNKDAWLPYQIPGTPPGPVATSDSVTFNVAGTYEYVDANNQTAPGGTIIVS